MQLMIDLSTKNDPGMLRRIAALLIATANNGFLDVAAREVDAATVPSGTAAVEIPAPPAPAPAPAAPVPDAPPPPPAPPAPVVALAQFNPEAQLDKRGFPYDARIHSAGANINKSDGLWRTKRGVDNALIESVEAELRGLGYGVAVPAAPVAPPPPPSVPAPPAPGAVPPPPPPPVSVPVVPNASGGAPSVPSSNGAGDVDQFRVLMNTIGGHTGPDGKCRREIMAPIYRELLGRDGGLPDFHKARDKIPALLVKVREIIGA